MTCAHCSLPLGRHVVDDRFCCSSCSAVYAILHKAGIAETFYRLKSVGDEAPVSATAGPTGATVAELNSPVFLEQHTSLDQSGRRKATLYLEGVHCAACVWLVEGMAGKLPGVGCARLDLAGSRLALSWDPGAVSLGAIAQWLGRFGYTPHASRDLDNSAAKTEENKLLWRVGLAWALAANVMILAVATYAGLGSSGSAANPNSPLLYSAVRWASLFLTVPALLIGGRVFFVRAIRSLRSAWVSRSLRHLDMDTPVAIGLTVGFADSARSTVTGTGEIWFDSLTLLVAALLTARWLQLRSRRMASEAADRLAMVLPTLATVRMDSGQIATIPTSEVLIGDHVLVEPGGIFPADGVILEGRTSVDRSAMTGESRPESAAKGSSVLAGTLNVSDAVVCKVSESGETSRVSNLLSTTRADSAPAPIVHLADNLSGYFVATVLTLAVTTMAVWLALDPSVAVSHTVALLVITCPCALGMATPLALAVASGRAARRGIFIKSDAALQALSDIDIVVLDKTGTITRGHPRMTAHHGSPQALRLAAALEFDINHPIARAVLAATDRTDIVASSVDYQPGLGVSGMVNGYRVRVGKPVWASKGCSDDQDLLARVETIRRRGHTAVTICVDGAVSATLAFGDAVRPEAAAIVKQLRRRGHEVFMLSGDHMEVAAQVAEAVGISAEQVFGDISPFGKRALIESWQEEGKRVVMVGDGLNDAPALRRADVGIAMDSGQQANRFAADIVTTQLGLSAVSMLVASAATTMRAIRRNLGISVGYNVVVAGAAMAGLVSPLVAAIAMPISSLFVVGSSLRLRVFLRPTPRPAAETSKQPDLRPFLPQPAT